MSDSIVRFILYFALYSFIGWVCESTWVSLGTRKPTNRGFLTGPYIPVYGFGAMLILYLCMPLKAYPWLVFIVAVVATSALEYFTGWLLETLFHMRWWDYSKRRFTINGRIYLGNSLLFGVMGLAMIYLLNPMAEQFIQGMRLAAQRIVAIGFSVVFLADFAYSLSNVLGLRKRMSALRVYVQELLEFKTLGDWLDPLDLQASTEKLRALHAKDGDDAVLTAILEKLDTLIARRRGSLRLLHAFPSLTSRDLTVELETLRKKWIDNHAARRKRRQSTKKKES